MSRSVRSTPIVGFAPSDKADKFWSHRKYRRVIKEKLNAEPEVEVLPAERQLTDPWRLLRK